MRKHLFIAYYLIIILIFNNCRSDEALPKKNVQYTPQTGVWIINEGNFGSGSGAVSYYNPSTKETVEDIYQQVNGKTIGNVCQSMFVRDSTGFIVVNNSQKIEMVHLPSFKNIGTIQGFNSPRYFTAVSATKAYVTDLYDNAIAVVDLSLNKIIKKIPCNGSTEELVLFQNKVFVSNTKSAYIYVINIDNDIIEDSIRLSYCSASLRIDKLNHLWVFCTGDFEKNINAHLFKINPINKSIITSFELKTPLNVWDRLDINGSKDSLYIMNKGIYQIPINTSEFPSKPIIPANGRNFYGLGIDPTSGDIFIADALDFAQKGIINVYKNDSIGNWIIKDTFKASIIPSDFVYWVSPNRF